MPQNTQNTLSSYKNPFILLPIKNNPITDLKAEGVWKVPFYDRGATFAFINPCIILFVWRLHKNRIFVV